MNEALASTVIDKLAESLSSATKQKFVRKDNGLITTLHGEELKVSVEFETNGDKVTNVSFNTTYMGSKREGISLDMLIDYVNTIKAYAVQGGMYDCCICGKTFNGYGNNAQPVKEGRCCDLCNMNYVIPARLELLTKGEIDG